MLQKKLISILTCSVLTLTLVSAPVKNTFAVTTIPNEKIVSEEFAKKQSEIQPKYGENEKITVVSTEYQTVTLTPSGQPAGGNNFKSGGSLFLNYDSGGSQSISVGLGWEPFSFSVSTGQMSTNAYTSGSTVNFPAGNNYYIVKLNRRMKFERHKVDVYQYNTYQYTYYTTVSSIYSNSHYLQQVY